MAAYKRWHEFIPHFPKTSRYTLGSKIDSLFIEIIERAVAASYRKREEKLPLVESATHKLDLLKFFLQISWEIRALDTKKYIALSERLEEIGRMLGGWLKQLGRETSASGGGK